MRFAQTLDDAVARAGHPAVVGLDPHPGRVPGLEGEMAPTDAAAAIRRFGLQMIEALDGIVGVVKPQAALFEAWGAPGVAVLQEVVAEARRAGLFVILDAKRGDIGSTAEAYARATLDDAGPMGADAVTVSPYLGPESLAPFVARAPQGKGIFVLLRTSNPQAAAWQTPVADGIAQWIAERTDGVGAVVGATLPVDELIRWRTRLPHTWLLVPGIGAQGADPDEVRPALAAADRNLISTSRSVLFPASGHDRDVVLGIRGRAGAFRDLVTALVR